MQTILINAVHRSGKVSVYPTDHPFTLLAAMQLVLNDTLWVADDTGGILTLRFPPDPTEDNDPVAWMEAMDDATLYG